MFPTIFLRCFYSSITTRAKKGDCAQVEAIGDDVLCVCVCWFSRDNLSSLIILHSFCFLRLIHQQPRRTETNIFFSVFYFFHSFLCLCTVLQWNKCVNIECYKSNFPKRSFLMMMLMLENITETEKLWLSSLKWQHIVYEYLRIITSSKIHFWVA